MKVRGTNGVGAAGGAKAARPAQGGAGFRIDAAQGVSAPSQAARASGVAGVASVDALLALQDVGGPLERRRRAVGRAGRILDVLDSVKLKLLEGALETDDLVRLQQVLRDQRNATDDSALEAVLDEVETRAAVELAKLEQASRAA